MRRETSQMAINPSSPKPTIMRHATSWALSMKAIETGNGEPQPERSKSTPEFPKVRVILKMILASYPGLLTPAFVACSTNAGKGLIKLSHVQCRTWTCGGVAYSFCTAVKRLSESKRRHQTV